MSKVTKRSIEERVLDLAIANANESLADGGARPAEGSLVEVTALDRQLWAEAVRLESYRLTHPTRSARRKRGGR